MIVDPLVSQSGLSQGVNDEPNDTSNDHILPPSYSEFIAVLASLYQGEEADKCEEIAELNELFLGKPYAIFYHTEFLNRFKKSSLGTQQAFYTAMKNAYQGKIYTLFLDNEFVVDLLTKLQEPEANPERFGSVMTMFYLLTNMVAFSDIVLDQDFIDDLCADTTQDVTDRALRITALYTFLSSLVPFITQSYIQDVKDMLEDAQEADLLEKYKDMEDISVLLQDQQVIQKLEGGVEWIQGAIEHLATLTEKIQEFSEKTLAPYIAQPQEEQQ